MRDLLKNLFRIPDPWVKKTPDPGSATLIITIEKINTILIFKCHLGKKIRRHTSIIQKQRWWCLFKRFFLCLYEWVFCLVGMVPATMKL